MCRMCDDSVKADAAEATKVVHGAKHVARLQRRADALQARIERTSKQVDFDDERAELKSLRWAINELTSVSVREPAMFARDLDCTGSLHPCNKLDLGAIALYTKG